MCGYSVDWLRSCYSTQRAVFQNDPTIVLPGYYYFSPNDVPFYPGEHWYGSNNWIEGDPVPTGPLGEMGVKPWRNGRPPAMLPLARLVGDEPCIREGSFWPVPGDIARTIIAGFDSRCFAAAAPPPIPRCPAITSIATPAVQAVYARLIQLVYDENWTLLKNALLAWLGPPITVHTHGAFGIFPARAYVDLGGGCWMVLVSGTTNFQQMATQSFYAFIGPQDYGAYATNANWYGVASLLTTEMNTLGVSALKPIVFVGHSYGAAIAAVAAAQIENANPDAPLYLLTFGMPKLGDQNLVNLIAGMWHMSIVNHDDLVHTLPPDGFSAAPFLAILPIFGAPNWGQWRPVGSYLVLSPPGIGTMASGVFVDAGTLGPLVDAILAGNPLAPIAGHPIAVYAQNLWMRQNTPTWPVTPAVWQLLFPTFTRGGGFMGDGTGNDTTGVLLGVGGVAGDGLGELV